MCTINTADGLSVLATCTMDIKQWYMQNGLQLNLDKSEVLLMRMTHQLQAVSSLPSVSVAGVDLPVAVSMKVLGITLDDIRQPRVSNGAIMQLRTRHPSHTSFTNTRSSTDACI